MSIYDDPTDLTEIARAEQRANAAEAREIKQERDDLAWLMSGPRGRRIVWRQIDRAGVLKGTSFSPDGLTMAFAEGVRNPAMRLLSLVLTLPEFAVMVSENTAAQKPQEEPVDD